jgi:RNA polymerase sigma factor (sigma-70 family)
MGSTLAQNMSEKKQNTTIPGTVAKYGKQLLSFIRRRVNSVEDAEDILQEVWYQFSRLGNINELDNISAWLYSVSRNKITDLYRKNKPDSLEDYLFENEEGDQLIKEILLSDDSETPEMALIKDHIWAELAKALEELPDNQRRVFVQNEFEDRTLQEIADAEGENLKTIISRKGYAVKQLRKRLIHIYEELYI